MANNFKAGVNFAVSKIANTFATLGLTSSNVLEIYTTDNNGNPISWRPDKTINTLPTGDGIKANQGYLINAKVDFENLFFSPPIVLPVSWTPGTPTTTTIPLTITEVVGATGYEIEFSSTSGSGSVSLDSDTLTTTLTGLVADKDYTITIKPVLPGNITQDYGATPQVVHTAAA